MLIDNIDLYQVYILPASRQAVLVEAVDNRFDRVFAACLAISFLRFLDNFFARAGPPSRPSAAACLFFMASSIA
jgi:hypothetical protein